MFSLLSIKFIYMIIFFFLSPCACLHKEYDHTIERNTIIIINLWPSPHQTSLLLSLMMMSLKMMMVNLLFICLFVCSFICPLPSSNCPCYLSLSSSRLYVFIDGNFWHSSSVNCVCIMWDRPIIWSYTLFLTIRDFIYIWAGTILQFFSN